MPDGSPTSVKIAEVTTRVVQLVLIPRNKLTEIGNRDEVKNVGIYFLFGKDDIDNKSNVYKFMKNHIFNSPSAATGCVLARRANGWTEWKDKDGVTLDSLKRQA